MILRIFVVLLILLSCQLMPGEMEIIPTVLPYDVGDTLPDTTILDKEKRIQECISPYLSSAAFIYPITFNDVTYYYGCGGNALKSDKPNVILMMVVMDTAFVTPEGLKVGQPFTDALPFTNGEIIRMYDCWKVYVKLPSGWDAVYLTSEHGKYSKTDFEGKLDTIPITRRKIEYFFKTDYTGEPSEYELRYLKKVEGYDINPDE